jgi:hypothetical protein
MDTAQISDIERQFRAFLGHHDDWPVSRVRYGQLIKDIRIMARKNGNAQIVVEYVLENLVRYLPWRRQMIAAHRLQAALVHRRNNKVIENLIRVSPDNRTLWPDWTNHETFS